MRVLIGSAMGLLALSGVACSKKESPTAANTTTTAAVEAPKPSASESASQTPAPAPSPSSSAAAIDAPSSTPPASFSGAETVKNAVATGLGCEARTRDGWLELLCRKKNGSGGHPKVAALGTGEEAPQVTPDDQGELHVVVPYHSGAETIGTIEWTDTKYNLTVRGTELKLDWAVGLEVRRSCSKLEKEKSDVISKALKVEDPEHLTAAESAKFPRFGSCQSAGLGSWALALRSVSASGKDDTRAITFEIDIARVDAEGKVTRADFGTIQTKPGGLEIRPLQTYDYDDDGNVELIVPHDVKALPKGATPKAFSAVWTEQGGQIVPYKNFPPVVGGAQTTQLEFDMRPDIGSYEPFIAYLTDCTDAACPPRLTGPVRYARSLPDGGFSRKDTQAQASITRTCPKGALLVVDGNPTRTALSVGCARLRGEDSAKIEADLKGKSSSICKGAGTCPLLDALVSFANAKLED